MSRLEHGRILIILLSIDLLRLTRRHAAIAICSHDCWMRVLKKLNKQTDDVVTQSWLGPRARVDAGAGMVVWWVGGVGTLSETREYGMDGMVKRVCGRRAERGTYLINKSSTAHHTTRHRSSS
jgi:hypothetical protein